MLTKLNITRNNVLMKNRLVLGTAQFGMPYGIANQIGQVSNTETTEILKHASSAGMNTLDTAIAYGDAEKHLGMVGIKNWNVISKLPPLPENCIDIKQWAFKSVKESINNLGVTQLYGLLLHKPQDLLGEQSIELNNALNELEIEGLIKNIGISIYDTDGLDELIDNNQIDIVQAPFNIIDHRLIDSGWLTKLASKNIEIHARSIFLQGLLLMEPLKRPENFNQWNGLWSRWQQWLSDSRLTPLQACLGYVLKQSEINRIIVGVDSLNQLQEILLAANTDIPEVPSELNCADIGLINPAKW